MMRTLAILIVLALYFNVQGQKKYTNTEKAEQLRCIYKNKEVVASSNTTIIRFEIENEQPVVSQTEVTDLIALQSNIKYFKNVYYNDNVELLKGVVKYKSGKGLLKYNNIFGNYEVDNVFYSDAKVGHYSFDMLYEATEVTFESVKKFKDPKYLTRIYFKDTEPTHKRDISFIIPEGIDVELVEMNFEDFDITKTIEAKDGLKHITYTSHQLNELEEEDNSPGILHTTPHIIIITKSYTINGTNHSIIANTDDLYKWYHQLVENVNVDPTIFAPVVEEVIKDASSEEEKIKQLYYWIQENIKYIAFENGIAGFQPEAPQTVFIKRYGDCKGMAILTKAMLNVAGIDARLTWIGTNKIPYNYDLPSLAVDNHMICTAFVNDKMYILDATEKYIALNKIAERIQGKEMLIEDGKNYLRKTIPHQGAAENLVSRNETIHIKNNCLLGRGQVEINGETKKSILYISNNSKVEDKAELFDFLSVASSGNTDLVMVNNTPETDRDKPLTIDYTYSINNKISQFDNELFIELDWEKPMSQADIQSNRRSAYAFGHKIMNMTTKKLSIPSGYKMSHLPEKVYFESENIKVNVSYQLKGNTIVYSNLITIANGKIMPEEFESWNQIVEQLNTFYNDQIILRKL